jgi:hypothetical protein
MKFYVEYVTLSGIIMRNNLRPAGTMKDVLIRTGIIFSYYYAVKNENNRTDTD